MQKWKTIRARCSNCPYIITEIIGNFFHTAQPLLNKKIKKKQEKNEISFLHIKRWRNVKNDIKNISNSLENMAKY